MSYLNKKLVKIQEIQKYINKGQNLEDKKKSMHDAQKYLTREPKSTEDNLRFQNVLAYTGIHSFGLSF